MIIQLPDNIHINFHHKVSIKISLSILSPYCLYTIYIISTSYGDEIFSSITRHNKYIKKKFGVIFFRSNHN